MIICDIDGCIFDNNHRTHLIPSDKSCVENWARFNKACLSDKPIKSVIDFVKFLALQRTGEHHRAITFVTSRGLDAKDETRAQLTTRFFDFNISIKMRRMDDNRSTVDYKRDVFLRLSDKFVSDSVIIDDHAGVIKMVEQDFPMINRILVPSFDCTIVNEFE